VEFADLLCGTNEQLKMELLKLTLSSGHYKEFEVLSIMFDMNATTLSLDEAAEFPSACQAYVICSPSLSSD
jgi:hypothetical protein